MNFLKKYQYNIAVVVPFIIETQLFSAISLGSWRNEVSHEIARRMTFSVLLIGIVFTLYFAGLIFVLVKNKRSKREIIWTVLLMGMGVISCLSSLWI